jgi:hypothetical protein
MHALLICGGQLRPSFRRAGSSPSTTLGSRFEPPVSYALRFRCTLLIPNSVKLSTTLSIYMHFCLWQYVLFAFSEHKIRGCGKIFSS